MTLFAQSRAIVRAIRAAKREGWTIVDAVAINPGLRRVGPLEAIRRHTLSLESERRVIGSYEAAQFYRGFLGLRGSTPWASLGRIVRGWFERVYGPPAERLPS